MKHLSCYVYPPVGNFQTHFSGTIDKERDNEFDGKPFVGQSVMPHKKGWPRQLCRMIDQKGAFEVIHECVFEGNSIYWFTCLPPLTPYEDSELMRSLLRGYGWLSREGSWTGPAKGRSSKGKRGGEGSQHDLLRRYPEALKTMDWGHSPISMFAAEIVTDFPDCAWAAETTYSSRYWKARRRDIANYKRREFTCFSYKAGISK